MRPLVTALTAALALIAAAAPAGAERPADILARQRGVASTDSGPLGSAFPAQYVEAYRFTPRPPVVIIAPQPPLIVVAMPLAGSTTPARPLTSGVVLAGRRADAPAPNAPPAAGTADSRIAPRRP